jgi:hypothetical protein
MAGQPGGIWSVGPMNRATNMTEACCGWSVQFWATTVAVAVCPGVACGGLNVSELIWIVPVHVAAAAGGLATAIAPAAQTATTAAVRS